jgi:hypothetical protein
MTGRRARSDAKGFAMQGPVRAIHALEATAVAIAFAGATPVLAQVDDAYERNQRRIEQSCIVTGACDNHGPGPAPQRVILHFTAIALSPSTLRVGGSHGQNSEAAANDTALRNCAAGGARDCKLLNWGDNICLALAVSTPDGSYGQAPSGSRAGAASRAMAECRKAGGNNCVVQVAPCAGDDVRVSSPMPLPPAPSPAVPVDPRTVGTWELAINPGRWVWEIAPDGAYTFHSEAIDGAPSHTGVFTASDGRWSLRATGGYPGYSDAGTYTIASPGVMIGVGQRGQGTWRRIGPASRRSM